MTSTTPTQTLKKYPALKQVKGLVTELDHGDIPLYPIRLLALYLL